MKQALALFIFLFGLLLPSISAGADVHLNVDGLTVDIQDEPLEGVLRNLAQQADFDLMILQKRDFAGETVSEEFHNLSLEEGVHRLLPAWNYGITKDKKTGQIHHMFVVSKRNSATGRSTSLPLQSPHRGHNPEEADPSQMQNLENSEKFKKPYGP